MNHRRTCPRREPATLVSATAFALLVAVLPPAVAMAKGRATAGKKDKAACASDYTLGKARAGAALLREARELFARCAKASCGGFLQQECGHLYTQTDTDIPSVVPFVTDESGTPRALVEVKVDGALLTSHLDGHAVQVDPGKRLFSFEDDDGVFATRKIMILQGQHNIPIKAMLPSGRRRTGSPVATAMAREDSSIRRATFEASPPAGSSHLARQGSEPEKVDAAPATESESESADEASADAPPEAAVRKMVVTRSAGIPVTSYVLGGVGVAALAGYFLLNAWGRKDNDKLATCADVGNLCQPGDVEHVRRLYLAANISGGVGLAALATSAFLYLRASSATEEAPPTRIASLRSPRRPSIRMIDVQATSSGALATVGGAF